MGCAASLRSLSAFRVASVRLLCAEASAALARAHRMARLTTAQLDEAIAALEAIVEELDHVEVTDRLVRAAGVLARTHGLRGYDAVHLGAGLHVSDDDFVFVTGDSNLAASAHAMGVCRRKHQRVSASRLPRLTPSSRSRRPMPCPPRVLSCDDGFSGLCPLGTLHLIGRASIEPITIPGYSFMTAIWVSHVA